MQRLSADKYRKAGAMLAGGAVNMSWLASLKGTEEDAHREHRRLPGKGTGASGGGEYTPPFRLVAGSFNAR
jgi:hypothetical protein